MPETMTVPQLVIPPNSYRVSWGTPSGTIARYEVEQHANSTFTALVSSWQRAETFIDPVASMEATFMQAKMDLGWSGVRELLTTWSEDTTSTFCR